MTQDNIIQRHQRPVCPRAPECPGHCTLCLKPIDNCNGHDPARYERFGMSREPTRCYDNPAEKPKPDPETPEDGDNPAAAKGWLI